MLKKSLLEGHQDHEDQQGFQPLLALAESTEHDQAKVNILRLLELANSNEDLASPLDHESLQVYGGRQAHGGLHEAHPYWNNLSGGRRYQEGRQHEHGFQPLIVHGAQGHKGRQDRNSCVAAGWGFQPLRVPGAQANEITALGFHTVDVGKGAVAPPDDPEAVGEEVDCTSSKNNRRF